MLHFFVLCCESQQSGQIAIESWDPSHNTILLQFWPVARPTRGGAKIPNWKFFSLPRAWGRTWKKKWTKYMLAEKIFLKKVIVTIILEFCRVVPHIGRHFRK